MLFLNQTNRMNAMPQLDKLIEAIRLEATRPEYQLTGTHPLLASPSTYSAQAVVSAPANNCRNELQDAPRATVTQVDDLLMISDNTQFIETAYQTLLKRPPDAFGSQTYMEKLTQGFGQTFVLAALRASAEGKMTNTALAGFGLAPLVYNVWRVGRRLGLGTPTRLLCNAYSGWRHLRLAASGRLAAQINQNALGRQIAQATGPLAEQVAQIDQRTQSLHNRTDLLAAQSTALLSVQDDNALVLGELSQKSIQLSQEIALERQRLENGLSLVDAHHRALLALETKTNFELQIVRARILAMQHRMPTSTSLAAKPEKAALASQNEVTQGTSVGASQEEMDAYYLAFENAHRGSFAEITKKVTPYLALVAQLPAEILGLPMVDLGCGRGEWLELLREQGFEPQGIDVSPAMVQHCQARGLKVELNAAVQWLAQQRENSCALLTGFHIIEHIPFAERLALVKDALRVLAPGGALILETPNPESVLVGSHTFFHDYTHTQPITPTSLQFLLGYQGFVDLQVLRLNPYPASDRVNDQSLLGERVNGHLYGPQDFSVIGYKP